MYLFEEKNKKNEIYNFFNDKLYLLKTISYTYTLYLISLIVGKIYMQSNKYSCSCSIV